MKYKVGDKVIIKDNVRGHAEANSKGGMNKWIGKTMTIRTITKEGNYYHYFRMEEDIKEHNGNGWAWAKDMVELKVKTRGFNIHIAYPMMISFGYINYAIFSWSNERIYTILDTAKPLSVVIAAVTFFYLVARFIDDNKYIFIRIRIKDKDVKTSKTVKTSTSNTMSEQFKMLSDLVSEKNKVFNKITADIEKILLDMNENHSYILPRLSKRLISVNNSIETYISSMNHSLLYNYNDKLSQQLLTILTSFHEYLTCLNQEIIDKNISEMETAIKVYNSVDKL